MFENPPLGKTKILIYVNYKHHQYNAKTYKGHQKILSTVGLFVVYTHICSYFLLYSNRYKVLLIFFFCGWWINDGYLSFCWLYLVYFFGSYWYRFMFLYLNECCSAWRKTFYCSIVVGGWFISLFMILMMSKDQI